MTFYGNYEIFLVISQPEIAPQFGQTPLKWLFRVLIKCKKHILNKHGIS